jgi:geranylgeranyl diphosphate synthase type I
MLAKEILSMPKQYDTALDYLLTLPVVQAWGELRKLLTRTMTTKVRHWELPALACQAVGGSPSQAIPATAALVALYLAIILVDDMLDEDDKGYFVQSGYPATSHLAGALQAVGLEAIAQCNAAAEVKAAVGNKLNSMLLSTALGQYWDIHNPQDEGAYWRVVQTKSAPFFGAALYVGALMGGAPEEQATKLERIGRIYGELIQLHDDLHDVMQQPANADWTQGRSPLPILFATLVSHPDQARFQALRQQIHAPDALAEAQAILMRCGAVSYVVDQLLQRHRKAEALLTEMELVDSRVIRQLLDKTVQPVHHLLESVELELTA